MAEFPGSSRFELENDSIVYDVIDGDTVIMNLKRGSYYGLNASAGLLWQLVVRRVALADIMTVLESKGHPIKDRDLSGFVQRLLDLGLITLSGSETPDADEPTGEVRLVTWNQPVITEYSDMKDLLAMDPPLPDPR